MFTISLIKFEFQIYYTNIDKLFSKAEFIILEHEDIFFLMFAMTFYVICLNTEKYNFIRKNFKLKNIHAILLCFVLTVNILNTAKIKEIFHSFIRLKFTFVFFFS